MAENIVAGTVGARGRYDGIAEAKPALEAEHPTVGGGALARSWPSVGGVQVGVFHVRARVTIPRVRFRRGAKPPSEWYTGRVAGKCAALFAFLLVLVAPYPSLAEHTIYYRYTVLGYVKQAGGTARSRILVELVREKTGLSYLGKTDETGLYVIVARLGDESVGETLRLRAAGQTVTVTARFDPVDHGRERGTRVDFIGRDYVEKPTAFTPTLQHFLAQ